MMRVRDFPAAGVAIARTYGARGAMLRAGFELRRRTDRFRAAPSIAADLPHDGEHAFAVDGAELVAATDRTAALERADRVLSGSYQAFRNTWLPLPADTAGWHRHPMSGAAYDATEAWWRVHHLDPVRGDIKLLWEPARFAWAYDLVRGYLITRDDRYAAAFHERLEVWDAANPAYRGPHWSCGQETAIRAAAWLYAEANLAGAPSSTAPRMRRLARLLAISGERIDDAIGYGISQRNNHGLSEAAGLVMLGARFRARLPQARGWLDRGVRWLERQIPEQFAEDGWYIQHSFNYMRVALDQCVLAQRALRSVGLGLSAAASLRLRSGIALLGWVIEPARGVVPNHGANDGAFVHPITLASYRDFRPVITSVCATFGFPLPGEFAPDAEAAAWLGVRQLEVGTPLRGLRVGVSGWAAVRTANAAIFIRAGEYRSRPGHSDALHVDIRFGEQELVLDPGTFSYNAPPLDREFASARVHNGPLLDDHDWAVRGGRFLWLRWPRAVITESEWDGTRATITACVPGKVRRSVTVHPENVQIRDHRIADGAKMVVRWLLPAGVSADVATFTPPGVEVDPVPGAAPGWVSYHYGERTPAKCVEVREQSDRSDISSTFKPPAQASARDAGEPARNPRR